jgi:hypothetical protein
MPFSKTLRASTNTPADAGLDRTVATTRPEGGGPAAEEPVTAADLIVAERRVKEARERAARAGLSAARSFEETARLHQQVAQMQDQTADLSPSEMGVHRELAIRHRNAADEDRALANQKRRESEADLSPDREEYP